VKQVIDLAVQHGRGPNGFESHGLGHVQGHFFVMGHGNPNQQHLRIQVRQSFSVLGFNMVDGTEQIKEERA
jgi:hypothetical protein